MSIESNLNYSPMTGAEAIGVPIGARWGGLIDVSRESSNAGSMWTLEVSVEGGTEVFKKGAKQSVLLGGWRTAIYDRSNRPRQTWWVVTKDKGECHGRELSRSASEKERS